MVQITKIEPQKNKSNRVNIYIDYEFFCGLENFVCVKYGLKEGMTLAKDDLLKMVVESDYEQALNKTAKLLNKMLKTKKQVREYLIKHGYSEIIIEKVIDKLTEYGYINDEHFVNMYIATYGKKFGAKKIEFELLNKGVSKQLIKNALEEMEQDDEVVLSIAKKYLKDKPLDLKNMQKLTQHLAYKGFNFEQINSCINILKKEKR